MPTVGPPRVGSCEESGSVGGGGCGGDDEAGPDGPNRDRKGWPTSVLHPPTSPRAAPVSSPTMSPCPGGVDRGPVPKYDLVALSTSQAITRARNAAPAQPSTGRTLHRPACARRT